MKLEEQVCSLELAKELKELGVRQESYFQWLHSDVTYPAGNKNTRWFIHHGLFNTDPYEKIDEVYAAFTVAELGEMLPEDIEIVRDDDNKNWRTLLTLRAEPDTTDPKMVDACAKILIYLVEKKLITLPQ